ncbi:MAG: carboxypeptidase regulatory-like domain-containing protein [Saprospiraceae bacterium]
MKKLNYFLLALMAFSVLSLNSCGSDDETDDPDGSITFEEATTAFANYFDTAGNTVTDPAFEALSIKPTADLGTTSAPPAAMENAAYKGAIDPDGATPWYAGWSFYSRLVAGNMNSDPLAITTAETITDDGSGTGTVTWSNDKTYVLDGFVFVNEGQTLTIEPGTIIQGMSGEAEEASALIVARGGKIIAEGTATDPIVFTFDGDAGNTPATTRGQWGGLIILGNAGLNSNPGETAIEGIPTTETRGLYGGDDNSDDSGILKYVSIRHGGTLIGGDNEINGLTLGGVGSGTTIEYVEVVGNQDDGIEWFGGTVQGNHLITAFCADDGLDYDEGYRGWNQFCIIHQDPADAGSGGEHDGGTDPEAATPFATPLFYNVTSIGAELKQALNFRDNAGGEYHNSIFTGYATGVDVELLESEQDSYKQFEDGNLKLENNVFHDITAGTDGAAIFVVRQSE